MNQINKLFVFKMKATNYNLIKIKRIIFWTSLKEVAILRWVDNGKAILEPLQIILNTLMN